MSFTSQVKNEIIGVVNSEVENISELAAILSSIAFKDENIKIVTENVGVAKRIFNLVKSLYNYNCVITVRKGYGFNHKYTYILEIKDKVALIEEDLGLDLNVRQQVPMAFVIGDEEVKKTFLRGLFLAVGSLNDPKKSSYHLEFVFFNLDYAKFVCDLLNDFDLKAKLINREKKYMVYIKEAEKISDFLKVIGAGGGLFYFEDVRIYRDHKNMTNRLNNCEQANVDKVINCSDKQIEAINIIIAENLYEALSDKLKVVADYRLKYPDASLVELAEIISMETGEKITKSGIYHRFHKIEKMASKIKNSYK